LRGTIEPLFALIVVGAVVAVAFARRLEQIPPDRLARAYLVGVTTLMAVRVAAYVAANVFGLREVRPASTGPYDLTNLLVGGLYGLAVVRAQRGGFGDFFHAPDVQLALRVATGVAFVLAGLVNAFIMNAGGTDYFVQMGYTKTFHLFIMTAEVLGGVALLLPWRWLTVAAACGLGVDMFGALYTQARAGDPLDAAAFAMLLRLTPLVALCVRGRWGVVGVGAVACAIAAIAGGTVLHHPVPTSRPPAAPASPRPRAS
jgi:uncharacterized membrane protein YphA (DoxX/SURF4 family)